MDMTFKQTNAAIPSSGNVGLWLADTTGHPTKGIGWDNYTGFVISAKTYDEVVEIIKETATDQDGFAWTIQLVGIDVRTDQSKKILHRSHSGG